MKRFKAKYHHCKVTVNAIGIGKIQIDVDDSDANQWANVKEFAFMIEDDIDEPKPVVVKEQPKQNDYSKMKLKELREIFPDIKATSVEEFVKQIQ